MVFFSTTPSSGIWNEKDTVNLAGLYYLHMLNEIRYPYKYQKSLYYESQSCF